MHSRLNLNQLNQIKADKINIFYTKQDSLVANTSKIIALDGLLTNPLDKSEDMTNLIISAEKLKAIRYFVFLVCPFLENKI